MRWIQTFGNHDGLMQGNVHRNDALNQIAVGPAKFSGPPPAFDPCNPFENLLAAPTTPADGAARIAPPTPPGLARAGCGSSRSTRSTPVATTQGESARPSSTGW